MGATRAAALCLLLFVACSSKASSTAPPPGTWRDQYVFVSDEGPVLAFVLQRSSSGNAEAKGWIGRDGAWKGRIYHRYRIAPRAASSRRAAAQALTKAPGTPVRSSIESDQTGLVLEVRTRASRLSVACPQLARLGEATDPEGTSRYRAGRATLTSGTEHTAGWLIAEETPTATPRSSFVDYGDFAFGVVASPRGALVFKQSRTRPGFTHVFGRWRDGKRIPPSAAVSLGDGALSVTGVSPAISSKRLAVDTTSGSAPGGRPVRYETWLLGGDWAGIVFAIRPAPSSNTETP